MTDLTELNTYVILTFSGNKYFITERQEKKLRGMSKDDIIPLNGNTIKASAISEIITLADYYSQHPSERPLVYNGDEIDEEQQNFKPTEEVLGDLKKGFLRAMAEKGYSDELAEHKFKTYLARF